MQWFQGSIPEAIGASRHKRCIFVVVVVAEDEISQQLLTKLEENDVSKVFENFVCICIKNGTTEASQFSQLYPLVVLPSIYMIGLQGSPLEIIGGIVDTSTLITRAQIVLDNHNKQQHDATQDPQIEGGTSSEVSAPAPATPSPDSNTENDEMQSALPLEARLAKAELLMSQNRQRKLEEEREKEKIKELERRTLGKQLQQFKDEQKEREKRELADVRQKERREEKEALEKIRKQIAQDRADRAARYQAAQSSEEERKRTAQNHQERLQEERVVAQSKSTRLQFRLPDGTTRTEQFASNAKLEDVTIFIDTYIQPPFKPYSICTTFPRREFSNENMQQTLAQLGLAPSAALLIVPSTTTVNKSKGSAAVPGWGFSSLFSPIFWLWNWIWVRLFSTAPRITRQADTDHLARGTEFRQPTSHGVRQRRPNSNIHRVTDNNREDSSDDNATWNGNSTQQL